MRVDIFPIKRSIQRLQVYRYDNRRGRFALVPGGIKDLLENDIFFTTIDGNIMRDINNDAVHVVLAKPVIETSTTGHDDIHYVITTLSGNRCIDAILNTRYIHHLNILPIDIPRIYRDCDFTKPMKRVLRSKRCLSSITRGRSEAKVNQVIALIKDSMDVFIKAY